MSWFRRKDPTEQLFNLKFSSKQLQKLSAKAEADEKREKANIKKALEQGNVEGARIYAENAIRKKNESLNFLRMSSRVDAVAARVQTAIAMNQLTKQMSGVVTSMDTALKQMDLEKVGVTMDKFEQQFETLDVQTKVMEDSMGAAMSSTVPEDQVAQLLQQVADEQGMEVHDALSEAQPGQKILATEEEQEEEKRLEEQLRRLREVA
eukprot:Clim_evm34s203 gene=Clim_evmTU34s203